VHVGTQSFDKIGTVPVFSFKTATDDTIAIDPSTGAARPVNTQTETFRLEGVIVRKVEPPSAAPTPQSANAAAATPEKAAKHRAAHHPRHRKH
jgi:hypothetical protein